MSEMRPRPEFITVNQERCTECGICEDLAPDLMQGVPVRMSPGTLDAMSECPTGAVVWLEPKDRS